jgi:hypothetical protein
MNLQENLKMVGELTIQVFNENGDLKSATKVPNLVVTNGKNYIASRMVGTAATVLSHMAIGTGTSSPAIGDTNLGTEAYRSSITLTNPNGGNTIVSTATFGAGNGTGAITEAAIFNYGTYAASPTSGQYMLCRTTFPAVNKASGDSIAISWTVTVS